MDTNKEIEGPPGSHEPDFESIAKALIDSGITSDDFIINYGHGPQSIAYGEDMGPNTQRSENRKFKSALEAILPAEDFGHYIVYVINELSSENSEYDDEKLLHYLEDNVHALQIPNPDLFPDSDANNQTSDPMIFRNNITSEGRRDPSSNLIERTNNWITENTEIVLAVALYEAIAREFVDNVVDELIKLNPTYPIDKDSLEPLYAQLIGNQNFYSVLVPIIVNTAIENNKKSTNIDSSDNKSDPENSSGTESSVSGDANSITTSDNPDHEIELNSNKSQDKNIITEEIISKALDFAKRAGIFRTDVDVPAHTSYTGEPRTQKFQCPASGTILYSMKMGIWHIYSEIMKPKDRLFPMPLEQITDKYKS